MAIIGTELNVLSVTGAKFSNVPSRRKIVLRLYLDSSDRFTLAAWIGKDIDYDSDKPLHTLDIKVLSGFKIQGGTLLGDQKIEKATIKDVKDELAKDSKYNVYFKSGQHIKYPNQLAYEILVGDKYSPQNFALKSFGQTKPSPPYNSGA